MKYTKLTAVFAASALALGMIACTKADEPEEPAAENTAAIVGTWQLSKVLVSEKEGEDPVEVKEEDHASMFGEKDNVYTFNADGTGTLLVVDGVDKEEKLLAWATTEEGSYEVLEADVAAHDMLFIYDPVDDVLMREFNGKDPYIHVVTVFARQ
ncbi:MAG: DUF5004 domain-containing protein [Solobacterium sp.]|nr:DUF5004 domain-containing protein [Solobacterium sp.]